jgi:O-antigen/teichoic acid export membrane protein
VGRERDRGLRRFLGSATVAAALKAGNAGLLVLAGVFVARLLGPAAYGAYAYASAWALILVLPSLFGTERLATREVAAAEAIGEPSRARGIVRRSFLTAAVASLAVLAVGLPVAYLALGRSLAATMAIAMLTVPFTAALRLSRAVLQGYLRPLAGQWMESIGALGLFVLAIAGAGFLAPGWLALPRVFALLLAATVLAAGINLALVRSEEARRLAAHPTGLAPTAGSWRTWLGRCGALAILSTAGIVNSRIDVVMLGSLASLEAAGLYETAARLAQFVSLFLIAANSISAPHLAALHAKGDHAGLQARLRRDSRAILLVSLVPAILLFIAAPYLVRMYGPTFGPAVGPMRLLILSNLLNVALGPKAMLMYMTGEETRATWGFVAALAVNVTGDLLLIPRFGLYGAAIAAMASQVTWNVVLSYFVKKRLGLRSWAF